MSAARIALLAVLGIAAGILATAPAAAQQIGEFENINVALQDTLPDCPSSNVCHFDFSLPGAVDLRQVACWNTLLGTTATQIATLRLAPGAAASKDIPLLPVKVTGNGFATSQRVFAPAVDAVRVTIQSFGAGIVAGARCAIAGVRPGDTYFSPTLPFTRTDVDADCSNDGMVCTLEIGPVPAGHRWVLDQVACHISLTSSTATQIVTLSTVRANGQTVAGFALVPQKLTDGIFSVSQRFAIPVPGAGKVSIRIQSFGDEIVTDPFCTLAGHVVALPPE